MKKAEAKNPKPDIHFRISAEDYRHIQAVAESLDRSVPYMIAQIVREWVEKSKGSAPKK